MTVGMGGLLCVMLIECSAASQESELLELLAPRGKKQLPPIVWARLYRSLELYLHPLGDEDENGMLGFFSQQMVHAVRKRYLQVGLAGGGRVGGLS
jgi:hypothetical protein